MAVTTEIPWGDGTSDKIYLTRNASEGNQQVLVSSDANTGAARSKVVTFSASGASPVTLTVSQEAGRTKKEATITVYPTSYDTVNISYESIDSSHPIEDALTDSSSSTYCLAYWKKGSSAETYFFLKFDFSSIPADANILSVSATAKGSVQITSSSRVTTRQMQLFSGATAKGDSHGISTTATAYSIVAGSWTRAELQDARMRYYVKRATNSSYYDTDYYLRMYGATMTVTYEYYE